MFDWPLTRSFSKLCMAAARSFKTTQGIHIGKWSPFRPEMPKSYQKFLLMPCNIWQLSSDTIWPGLWHHAAANSQTTKEMFQEQNSSPATLRSLRPAVCALAEDPFTSRSATVMREGAREPMDSDWIPSGSWSNKHQSKAKSLATAAFTSLKDQRFFATA